MTGDSGQTAAHIRARVLDDGSGTTVVEIVFPLGCPDEQTGPQEFVARTSAAGAEEMARALFLAAKSARGMPIDERDMAIAASWVLP